MKYFLLFTLVFIFSFLNAQQPDQKKIRKLIHKLNENIELIQENRKKNYSETEEYNADLPTVISPFLDYDFEILEPFLVDESGNISMKIKYLDPDGAFIQNISGKLSDLTGFGVDIYFLLEFKEKALLFEYVDLDTGEKQIFEASFLHFGIDQVGLVESAKKAGLKSEFIIDPARTARVCFSISHPHNRFRFAEWK